MKLVSVNVSLAQQLDYHGKTISTGIFKRQVNVAVEVTTNGLHGDEQVDLVNHGGEHKAVYGFSDRHYRYWQQQLKIDHIVYGSFGENLTINHLDESQLCIGDLLQINNTVLQVTQPRVPCYKLGIAFDNKSMPRLFTEHAETGIYFRVIQAGTVQAGDTVEVVERSAVALPVKILFQAYFDKTMPAWQSRDIMKKAAEIPALSAEWQEKVLSRLG